MADIYSFRLDRVSTESQIFLNIFLCVSLGYMEPSTGTPLAQVQGAVLAREETREQLEDKGSLDISYWKVSSVRAPISLYPSAFKAENSVRHVVDIQETFVM